MEVWINKDESETSPSSDDTTESSNLVDKKLMKLNGSECYEFNHKNQTTVELLDDILDSDKQPKNGKGIFLLETSCAKDGLIYLNPRYG